MRLISRDALNERLAETLEQMKSKGVEPTWDDAMYVIDMIDDAHDERRMKEVTARYPDGREERRMSRFNAETIANVVFELVGETEAYGDTYIDSVRVKNQQIMCDVIDYLILRVYENTKYAYRNEWSMKDIGMKAMEFLGYLVEKYDMNDYVVRKEE